MPYIVDLEKRASKLLHLTINPHGWLYTNENGVEIEFGTVWLNVEDPEPSMCMRVKGTKHVWAWFRTTFNQLAKDKYADFFTKQLEEFRIEFLLWIHSPVYSRCEWVGEYYEMFKGRFYDFSEEERKEFEQSKREWREHQSEIDSEAARIARRKKEEREGLWY